MEENQFAGVWVCRQQTKKAAHVVRMKTRNSLVQKIITCYCAAWNDTRNKDTWHPQQLQFQSVFLLFLIPLHRWHLFRSTHQQVHLISPRVPRHNDVIVTGVNVNEDREVATRKNDLKVWNCNKIDADVVWCARVVFSSFNFAADAKVLAAKLDRCNGEEVSSFA